MRWLCILFIALIPSLSEASTITAVDCSLSSVNAAVNGPSPGPAVDGDTVIIPVGTCIWGGVLSITNKSITIQGATTVPATSTLSAAQQIETVCNTVGQTTYTCLKRAGQLIDWTTKASGNTPAGFVEVTKLAMMVTAGAVGCAVKYPAGISLLGDSHNYRIHHNFFSHADSCGSIVAIRNTAGVIDHNTFLAHNNVSHAIVLTHSRWLGVGDYGDNSWAQDDTLGTAGAHYVEDNYITSDSGSAFFTDHQAGSRWVMRFNTIENGSIQNHGTESGGRSSRGPRHAEAYRQKFTRTTTGNTPTQIAQRGVGTSRNFDNVATGDITRVIDTNVYRAGAAPHPESAFYPWGFCGQLSVSLSQSGTTVTGTTAVQNGVHTSGSYIDIVNAADSSFNGTAIHAVGNVDTLHFTYTVATSRSATTTATLQASYDGNTDSSGYPCLDQVGRGKGTYLSGDPFTTQSPIAPLNQAISPMYCWNNILNGSLSSCQPNVGANVIIENRDFYNENTSFATNATAGIGRGLRSARPACTTAGTAYWSTNGGGNWNTSTDETYSALAGYSAGADGALDRCYYITGTSGPVQWTDDWYVPYTYPHPLTLIGSGGGGGSGGGPGQTTKRGTGRLRIAYPSEVIE